jgi:hypothetical protein
MFKYSFQKIPSLWVFWLKSCTYLSFTFAWTSIRTTVLDLITQNQTGGIFNIMGITSPACQFLSQEHVQNHSNPYTILIPMKIKAILLLLYRTRPAISLLEDQFQAFQFPTGPPIYCLYQVNIPLDAAHQPVPWLFSSILSTRVYTLWNTTQSTIHSISKLYVTFTVISMQSS